MFKFSEAFEPYGPGQKTGPGGLIDEKLLALFKRYKRLVAKRYRLLDPNSLNEKDLPKGRLWASPKHDGELFFLVKRNSDVALCAYNGRVIQGIPLIDEAEKLMLKFGDVTMAGELIGSPSDRRPRVHDVARALGDGKLAGTLKFRAFDLLDDGGEDAQLWPYEKRLHRMNALLDRGQLVSPVTTFWAEAATAPVDVAARYRDWVSSGQYEGIVVRTEHGVTFKVKPFFTIDALIVAFGERIVNGVKQIRELTVALKAPDGSLQILGPVGGGFTEDGSPEKDRAIWHTRLSAMKVESSFRMANREGTLCHFVKPEIVIEVKVMDVIGEGAVDKPVLQMGLAYNADKGYTPLGLQNFAAMIYPVYVRERTDKLPDLGSVGLEQVESRLGTIDRTAKIATEATEVIDRRAWTKPLKGGMGVRKYTAFATHKGSADPESDWAPFVAIFTDYSAGRADALQRDVVTAGTAERLQIFIQEWIAENVKGGWVESGEAPAPVISAKEAKEVFGEPKAKKAKKVKA